MIVITGLGRMMSTDADYVAPEPYTRPTYEAPTYEAPAPIASEPVITTLEPVPVVATAEPAPTYQEPTYQQAPSYAYQQPVYTYQQDPVYVASTEPAPAPIAPSPIMTAEVAPVTETPIAPEAKMLPTSMSTLPLITSDTSTLPTYTAEPISIGPMPQPTAPPVPDPLPQPIAPPPTAYVPPSMTPTPTIDPTTLPNYRSPSLTPFQPPVLVKQGFITGLSPAGKVALGIGALVAIGVVVHQISKHR